MQHNQETISIDNAIDRIYLQNNCKIGKKEAEKLVQTLNNIFYQEIDIDYIITRIKKYKVYQKQLEELKNIVIIEQRTQEWLDTRRNLVTASDFAQALGDGKFGSQKQFFMKKSGYEVDKFNPYIPALKWGTMFEPMATKIYEIKNGCKVHEFGLIKDEHIKHFGASPDGINDLGIMIEIKCPPTREITGQVPLEYFYQIQGQLHVCKLHECDFVECKFKCVDTLENLPSCPNILKGAISETFNDGKISYEYSDIVKNKDELKEWCDIKKDNTMHLWYLNQLNIVRVYRDEQFMNDKLPLLQDVWNKVLHYRNNKDEYDKDMIASSRKKQKNDLPEFAFINV